MNEIISTIRIEPETLNLKSNGVFTAFVSLKAGFDVNNIDPDTVVCFGASTTKFNVNGNDTMILKFRRGDMVGVPVGDAVEFRVSGCYYDGTHWSGHDHVRVINP